MPYDFMIHFGRAVFTGVVFVHLASSVLLPAPSAQSPLFTVQLPVQTVPSCVALGTRH